MRRRTLHCVPRKLSYLVERLIREQYVAGSPGTELLRDDNGFTLSGGDLAPLICLIDVDDAEQSSATLTVVLPATVGSGIDALTDLSANLDRYAASTRRLTERDYDPAVQVQRGDVLASTTYELQSRPFAHLRRSLTEIVGAYRIPSKTKR